MLKEFRDFVFRGNVVDLAVAFVIGGAFATVVNSFVVDVLTPLAGLLGAPELGQLAVTLPSDASIRYGAFIGSIIAFVPVAAAIYFLVVKPVERMRPPAEATTRTCPHCASEIPLAARRCPMCTSQLEGGLNARSDVG